MRLISSGIVRSKPTYLVVPCFTLRDNTERPVTVRAGTNTLLGLNPDRIDVILPSLARNHHPQTERPPGWDGRAAGRIADVICGVPADVAIPIKIVDLP